MKIYENHAWLNSVHICRCQHYQLFNCRDFFQVSPPKAHRLFRASLRLLGPVQWNTPQIPMVCPPSVSQHLCAAPSKPWFAVLWHGPKVAKGEYCGIWPLTSVESAVFWHCGVVNLRPCVIYLHINNHLYHSLPTYIYLSSNCLALSYPCPVHLSLHVSCSVFNQITLS